MPKTLRHVLKADQVILNDPLPLSLDPTASACCRTPRATPAAPSVRITQNHPEYAVIEVTCPCGRTTYLRCDYAATNPSPARQEPSQG